jgi:hypothetical protein
VGRLTAYLPENFSLVAALLVALIGALVFIVVAQFLDHLLPRLWMYGEGFWWKRSLGDSPARRRVRGGAEKEFLAAVKEQEKDKGVLRSVAVVKAIGHRCRQYPTLTREYKNMAHGMRDGLFRKALKSLNRGWRKGTPPQILAEHIKVIEDSEHDETIDEKDRLRGMSAVAMVKYALGDLDYGYSKGLEIWEAADDLRGDAKADAKWMASYAYFNSTMFRGHFEKAMTMMADQWSCYYAPLDDAAKENLRRRLADVITLNPVLIFPRHIILASAFNDGPVREDKVVKEKYWPNEALYRSYASLAHDLNDLETEIMWLEAWYDEAVRVCTPRVKSPIFSEADEMSLNFSHAYAAFYLTLLLGEAQTGEQLEHLHARINRAFDSIGALSPIVSQYVKYGFSGVYHFACGENQQALDNLRIAAESSAISGNKFAECIFICCHAVAAARLNDDETYSEPEIGHYLDKAEALARRIGGDFYPALHNAARAAVARLQGKQGAAEKYELRSKQARAGRRVLRLFQDPSQQPARPSLPSNNPRLLGPEGVSHHRG